ncbi:Piso0_001688 [Millerozyma farinosa CBS 7064]|uniref:non-specific serine/threonine protein kinase n=1 Tax=Pichia sorbitophila (strain ATCC MYA-4447 / BCRC 22081 / CBS 7064 / NBRC 10061 / NRRL Y-12695) TaxID=559304 RepID=G8YNU3_PICSO|nr:Piso0_001688 [Millerozyma farinosa CBS 7064]
MLKFKNKFKFGTSHQSNDNANNNGSDGSQGQGSYNQSTGSTNVSSPGAASVSRQSSMYSRKTISLNSTAENMHKLGLNDHDASSTEKSSTTSRHPAHEGKSGEDNGRRPLSSSGTVAASSASPSTKNSSTSPAPQATSTGQSSASSSSLSSGPGMLTVKIYNSSDIRLPIKMNNNRQILHTLASNASTDETSRKLAKALNDLSSKQDSSASAEYLPQEEATDYLPSIITIPNGENLKKSLLYLTVEFDNNVLVIEPSNGIVSQSTWNQVVSFDVTKKSTSVVGSNFLSLNLFIRLPNILIPESEKIQKKNLFTNNQASSQSNNIGDLLIGTIKLPLNLNYHSDPIRLMNHEYLNFTNYNITEEGRKNTLGSIMLTIDFKPMSKKQLSIEDFDLLKVIGKGSFGKVMQVVKKDTKQIYALKTLRKQHIISRMEVTHTLAERTVLARINNPFIVPLKFSFQSPEKLYLVLSFINGGELFWHLQREGSFSMNRSRFYIAELLTALESLHELNVVYRDLKPENILLDYQGHIALCDFGLCKLNMADNDKTNTFCGTPEYLAPELLLNQGYTRNVDWWTLGTLLYEMLTGLPPFYDDDVPTMYRKILQNPLKFPPFLDKTDAQNLLTKLLQKDPSHRLSDAATIKSHPFFKDIDWNKLLSKNYLPPFKPNVDSLLDTSNFDSDFTNEKPSDSVVDDFLSESMQKQFGGWTYNGDNVLS